MSSRKSAQASKIEALFLLTETVTVRALFETLYGEPESRTDRELSQAVGPALTRYCRRTGNDVQPTETPYTYRLIYA
jgi:hypothetical protein